MSRIFISYRREDSADVTGRIGDKLREHFGEDNVFTDVDDIPLGVDFRTHLDTAVSQCSVLLAVIGRNWLAAKSVNDELRLSDPADFVRIEIESALERGIPVIPLLVQGASVPEKNQLPPSMEALAFRNAQKIRPDPDFKHDVNRVVHSLVRHLKLDETNRLDDDDADQLKLLRRELLTSNSPFDFQRLKFKIENYLVKRPYSLDAQMLKEQVSNVAIPKPSQPGSASDDSQSGTRPWFRHTSMWFGGAAVVIAVVVLLPMVSDLKQRMTQANPPERAIENSTTDKPTNDFVAPEMVKIPKGAFMMGSDIKESEMPVHEVSVPEFEMARNELTWAEWRMCEESYGCNRIERPDFLAELDDAERLRHPVVNVNLVNVNEYITWINKKTGLSYRLPSEAEWEYAARAGSVGNFYFGDSIGQNQANCIDCGSQWDYESTAPAGSFEANAFGLHDMHGNVWERMADCWHEYYGGAPVIGLAWVEKCTESDKRSVIRGGSWADVAMRARSAARMWIGTDSTNDDIGFRLARTLP